MDRRTDGPMDRRTDRPTDGRTDRPMDRRTDWSWSKVRPNCAKAPETVPGSARNYARNWAKLSKLL
eukprot:1686451-Alexandrium_andersonii.AAC.1